MSLLDGALGIGRRLAEGRMTETVTVGVYRDTTDPTTGDAARALVEQHYSGKGRVKYPSLAVSNSGEPSQPVAAQQPYLSIPTGSPAVFDGDEVHVTASTVDESLVGRVYVVEGAPQSGQTTSHRYPLKELS